MFTYVCQRLLLLLPTFIGVTLVAFFIIHLAPGDPAELRAGGGLGAAGAEGISSERPSAVDQALTAWRAQYGLDRPLPVQYWRWLRNLFTWNLAIRLKIASQCGARLPNDYRSPFSSMPCRSSSFIQWLCL